jgi:glycosyltransferase involved in cell wall biosynthesis
MVEAIERLYEDHNRAERMGERARQHIVKNFNSKDVCSRLCEFYAQLGGTENTASTREEPAYHRS